MWYRRVRGGGGWYTQRVGEPIDFIILLLLNRAVVVTTHIHARARASHYNITQRKSVQWKSNCGTLSPHRTGRGMNLRGIFKNRRPLPKGSCRCTPALITAYIVTVPTRVVVYIYIIIYQRGRGPRLALL